MPLDRSRGPSGPVLPAFLPGAAAFGARCRGPCLVTVPRCRAGMRPDTIRPHWSRFAHTRSLPALSRLRLQGDRLVASRPGALFRWAKFTIICAPRNAQAEPNGNSAARRGLPVFRDMDLHRRKARICTVALDRAGDDSYNAHTEALPPTRRATLRFSHHAAVLAASQAGKSGAPFGIGE